MIFESGYEVSKTKWT